MTRGARRADEGNGTRMVNDMWGRGGGPPLACNTSPSINKYVLNTIKIDVHNDHADLQVHKPDGRISFSSNQDISEKSRSTSPAGTGISLDIT